MFFDHPELSKFGIVLAENLLGTISVAAESVLVKDI